MHHAEDFFSGRDGKKIFRQWWLPEGDPVASIVVVHGLAEHSGRYDNLVNHLVPLGYAVYGFDHLGHGRSDGHRAHATSLADFVDNLQRMVLWVKEQQKGKALYLLGHSMGGLITANYLLDHQNEVNGAIFSSPLVMSAQQPSLGQKLKAAFLRPVYPRAAFQKLDPEGISRDPDVVADYKADPLVYSGAMSIGLALTLGNGMSRIGKEANKITLPVLIVQGGQDFMVPPEGANVLHENIQSEDKQIQIYPEAYHEVLNEPEGPDMLALIEKWLQAHVKTA